jgi:hypothetical protein
MIGKHNPMLDKKKAMIGKHNPMLDKKKAMIGKHNPMHRMDGPPIHE